jgi:hypothetical protein
VKETTMNWTGRFRTSGKAKPADPWDETVIKGAPYDAGKGIRSPETPAALSDHPEADIAEEIKRRQIALAVRYVAAVRGR